MKIADIRKEYKLQSLNEADVAIHPIEQFTKWWNEAVNSNIDEVNAMTLSTISTEGYPSSRIVLLKEYTQQGFVFFTNYLSQKGQEIALTPKASLVFFWKELERQVCIKGTVSKIAENESDTYFFSRPISSRIGAWSSMQSSVIADRSILEQNQRTYEAQFGNNVPRPPHWGGYLIIPVEIEFWQGRSSRLHDRIRYRLQTDGSWLHSRLAP
jgi:pyridoxamine 5'-phosphate oxidase